MQKKLEAVVTDLDGSLLNSQHQICEEDLQTILKLKKAGIPVFLASGRNPSLCRYVAEEIGTDYPVIATNGAQIHDFASNKSEYNMALEQEYFAQVYEFIIENNLLHFVSTENQIFFDKANPKHTPFRERLEKLASAYGEVGYIDDNFDPYSLAINKVMIPECTPDIYDSLMNIPCVADGSVDYYFSGHEYVDIMKKGANKGHALEILSERYNFSLEHTLAMGDNYNDEKMLRAVGYPVVPSTAIDGIKELAGFVTAPNGENPLTHAIKTLFPGLL